MIIDAKEIIHLLDNYYRDENYQQLKRLYTTKSFFGYSQINNQNKQ